MELNEVKAGMALDIVAIIPARGGSKGIPGKNICPLAGKPLLAYTVQAALDSGICHGVYVSTDSTEIAEVARTFKAEVIQRPAEFSHDKASTESALIHALEVLEKERRARPTHVMTLQPTSPLRSARTIQKFAEHFATVQTQYDAMLSLDSCHGDYWVEKSPGSFSRLYPNAPRRRQDRQPIYLENSAIYITQTDALVATQSVLGTRCTGFVIDHMEAADINVPLDLAWAEFLLRSLRQ